MKRLILLSFVCLLAPSLCTAQTAKRRKLHGIPPPVTVLHTSTAIHPATLAHDAEVDRILERYVAAQGERRARMAIRTRVMRGVIEVAPFNLNGTFESYAKAPDKTLVVFDIPERGGQLINARIGAASWSQLPHTAAVGTEPDKSSSEKKNLDDDIAAFYEKYPKAIFKGRRSLDGRDADMIEATTVKGSVELLYFDAGNGLMVRTEFPGGKADEDSMRSISFGSFAKIDGVKVPTVVRQTYPKLTVTIRLYEVKHNVGIEDAFFTRPKGPNADASTPAQK
ncbi:MAG: hypothetical protein WCD76_09270 [Pyrinomonadaceae bacterium]